MTTEGSGTWREIYSSRNISTHESKNIVGYSRETTEEGRVFPRLSPVAFVINEGGFGSIARASSGISPETHFAVKLIPCTQRNRCPSEIETEEVGERTEHDLFWSVQKARRKYRTALTKAEYEWLERNAAEASAMKNLQSSPHVITMVEAGWYPNTGGRRFRTDFGSAMKREGLGGFGIAMELAQGDLQEKIYGSAQSTMQTALYVAGIVFGLRHMHAHGVLHCDLKPQNVFLVPLGRDELLAAKIGDLGSACCVERVGEQSDLLCASWGLVSCTESRPGTREYFAPEKKPRSGNTFATDVYTAGLVIYEILYSKRRGTTDQTTFSADSVGRFNKKRRAQCDEMMRREPADPDFEPDGDLLLPRLPRTFESIDSYFRKLLLCMLKCDPALRCSMDEASSTAASLLASLGADPKAAFQRSDWIHRSLPDRATSLEVTGQQKEQVRVAELVGDDTRVRVRNVDEFLFPLIREDLLKGSLEIFRRHVDRGRLPGKVVDALAAHLPETIRSWGKYQPDLGNSSRFEILGVRYQSAQPNGFGAQPPKEFSIAAFRAQPDVMEEAREAAASSIGSLFVHFRIESTPLTIMIGDQDFKASVTTVDTGA